MLSFKILAEFETIGFTYICRYQHSWRTSVVAISFYLFVFDSEVWRWCSGWAVYGGVTATGER